MSNKKRREPEPQRNYLCLYYDGCLDVAAMKNLAELPCRGCQYENDEGGRREFLNYMDGTWALLRELFYPRNKTPEDNQEHRLLFQFYWFPPVEGESETDDSKKRLH